MIKTVSLTADTETKVEISGGYNVGVINRTTGMLYASRNSGVSAGADDVAAIPAGDSYVIRAADDTVYLLATAAGDVQLESIGAKEVFKIAAARSSSGGGEGGGTVDGVARQAIETHANNGNIHHTEDEIRGMAAGAAINPPINLNPDFSVNQRGQTEYTGIGCNVDCWMGAVTFAKITVGDGIKCEVTADVSGSQLIEYQPYKGNVSSLIGRTVTVSAKVTDVLVSGGRFVINARFGAGDDNDSYVASASIPVTAAGVFSASVTVPETVRTLRFEIGAVGAAAGNYVHAGFIKVEVGAATPLVVDYASELARCQRYYQVRSTGDIDPVDLRPSMAEITDVKQREDGAFEYVAAL